MPKVYAAAGSERMKLTRHDIAVIERIVRQSSYSEDDPEEVRFGSWLSVDQGQFLALIELIPNRVPELQALQGTLA